MDALLALSRLGQCDDSGGGQPTPPALLSVSHDGSVAVSERDELAHIAV